MKNNENKTIKLEDLEVETIYKDNNGHFFKLFYDEYSDSPRLDDNVATILTWERNYSSPDENNDTFEEFAEKHGVDVSKEWDLDSVMDAMREEGYYVLPVYALHHGVSHYSIHDFHDGWDSGIVGIAFCERQNKGLPDNDDYLRMIIDREVEMYDAWINGEIYGIALFNQREEQLDESCGYLRLDDNRIETLKDMLSDVGVDIQDEYQTAVREVSVTLK